MLRLRTGYTFRYAVGKLEDCLESYGGTWGNKFAPITDRASTYGWVRWEKLCRKKFWKPVFGAELAVSPDIEAKRPIADYWLFYAANGDLAALNSLIALAIEQFRYQPLLTYEQAITTPNIISIAGHASRFELIEKYGNPSAFQLSPAATRGYINKVREVKGQFVPASENFYPSPEKRGLYEVVCGRNAVTQTYPLHILGIGEWKKMLEFKGPFELNEKIKIIKSGERILKEASKARLKKAALPKPEKKQTLLKLCQEGAKRTKTDLKDPVYKERLERELKLIKEKAYEDYFYIVKDVVEYAKERMVVGPARGSSCGSLVCYLLGITSIDPIPFGLIFERFIDVNRHDLPDIDIDFSDQHRSKVIRYLEKKYGKEHVSQLGTVALYRPRSAIQECSKTYGVPKERTNAVLDSILKRSGGDARAMESIEDCFNENINGKMLIEEYPEMRTASLMEGHPRHSSRHASAVILNIGELNTIAPVDARNGVVMLDKKDAEDLDLLKIDVLGLTQLSVLENAINLVQEHTEILQGKTLAEYLEGLPLDYEPAFKLLRDARWCGIFQFNGIALQSIGKQFEITSFDDIVSITSLARPGPLASGNAHKWVRRRKGQEPITYPHELFEPHIEDTYGVIMYQEQVMQIGREIGELDWGQVSELRRAMSKSYGKEYFDKFGAPWKKAAIKKGLKKEIAEKVWDDMCAYGSMAFNKSHALAYGMISYWCCYVKARWPLEFAAATLDFESDDERQILMLRELAKEGIEYEPYNSTRSTDRWNIYKGKLIGPLQNIKGIGPKATKTIIGSRARGAKLAPAIQKKLFNAKTTIDSLYPITDFLNKTNLTERNIYTQPTNIIELETQDYEQTVLIIATPRTINVRDLNEAVNIAKRGGDVITDGRNLYLNLQMSDDTDIIFCSINRYDYKRIAAPIVNRGRPGKAVYAIKGQLKADTNFRIVGVTHVRYLGDLDHGPVS